MQAIPLRKSFLLPLTLLIILSTAEANAGPPDAWYHRMLSLYGVAYGQDLFVTVGDGGTIQTSRDGIHWGAISLYATFKNLRGVAYGSGLFVAVGEDGSIITSPNGYQWTSQASQVTDMLWGITYGDGLFVAVGSMGTIVTSPNGVDWTKRNSQVSEFLYGAAYGNGKFVAVGSSGRILTSPNGVDWAPQQVTSYTLRGVAFGNNTFMAVGLGGTVLSSDTGLSWSQTSLGVQYSSYGISHGNGIFTAFGENLGTNRGFYAFYKDNHWDLSASVGIEGQPYYGATLGNSIAILVGGQGCIFRKMAGWTYSFISYGTPIYLNAVISCNNQVAAVGSGILMISQNGVTWRPEFMFSFGGTSNNLWAIASNGRTCVAVGEYGIYLSFIPGKWYHSFQTTIHDWLFAVAYGNGKFVAMGLSDKFFTSPDGENWTDHPLGALYWVNSLTYGNNKFVGVGLWGGVLTSPDGENWNFAPSGVPQTLNSVAYGTGLFVAVGDGGVILTSLDGTTWTPAANFPSSNNLYDVAFAGDSFFAVGAQGTIVFSEDGIHWSLHHSWTTKDLHGATWAGTYGVAVGADGTILQSGYHAKIFLPILLRN